MPDQRSESAAVYRRWYKQKAWLTISARQRAIEPLCRMCSELGVITAAEVCDHINPDKSTWEKFHAGPFQSLCKRCHDGAKQSEERNGYLKGSDANGKPRDPNHPWNRARP